MADYELTAISWDEPDGDGGFRRHRRGDLVELDEKTAARLVRARAVVPVDEFDEAPTGSAETEPAEQYEGDTVDDDNELDEEQAPAHAESHPVAGLERPRRAGSRTDWYAYALAVGALTAEQAEDLTKAQIIAAVESK